MTTYYVSEDGTGDGTSASTPDSVADHNADALGLTGGDVVYLLGEITSTVTPPVSGTAGNLVTYRGDWSGQEATLKGPDASSAALSATNIDFIKLQSISFTRAQEGVSTSTACKSWVVESCTFSAIAQRGMLIAGAAGPDFSEDWLIDDCTFTNIGDWGDTVAADINFTTASRNNTIRACAFKGNGVDKGVDGIIWSHQGADGNGSGNKIADCTFSGHEENCADLKGVEDDPNFTEFINCTFANSAAALVLVQEETRNVRFTACTFRDCSDAGLGAVNVAASRCTDIELYGCVFDAIGKQALSNVQADWKSYNCTYTNVLSEDSSQYPIDIKANGFIGKNNIFDADNFVGRSENTRYTFRCANATVYTNTTLDANSYGTKTANFDKVLIIQGGATKTLAQLQTDGKETNGIEGDPGLIASTYEPTNSSMKGVGVWISGVRDLDDLTLPINPDMGAKQDREAANRRFGGGPA